MALLGNFWLQRRDHVWRRGWGSLLGVYTQQVAGLENFWLFWIWHPGLLCKQNRTLGRNADEGSVAFDMSDTLVDRFEGAKASYEVAFEVVYDKLQELEDLLKGCVILSIICFVTNIISLQYWKKTKFLRKIIARAGRTEVRQAKKFMSMYLFKNTPSL